MGAESARKGATGEREVMAILREHGYNVERVSKAAFRRWCIHHPHPACRFFTGADLQTERVG